jgi:uncharacterized repeat protein (TIGR01451 family)
MLSEQNFRKWLFTSLGLLLRKYSLVMACSRSNCIKLLQTAYGYLTRLLVISVVSLVSCLGLSQQAQAHTTITKTTSTPLVAPGGTATYTINVTDAGTSSATTGITVTDALPTGFTYLSTQSVNTTVGATRPTTVNPTVGSNTPSWGTFNTPYPATPPNTFNITFDARVPIGGNCGKYDNAVTATATGGTHTYVPYTGTASTAEDVTVTGTLSASKTTSTPTVVNTPTGTQATYTIVLSNTGQCTIPNVSITDTLPTGFTYLSTGAVTFTSSATRPTTTNPTAGATNPVWSNFTIPNGGTVSLTFTAKIASSVANGTYNNNASATTTTAGITITPYVGTSLNQEDVTVTSPSADLTITKTHIGNFTQGQTGATYTLTATNSGTAATSGTVSVVDTLPTGLTATAISGTGWTCTLATLTCTRSDALTAGSSYPVITLTVNVAADAASSITNNAAVSGGGETNTGNDTTADPTTVNGVSDLTITKSHTSSFTQGQTGATYTLTATNSGTAATSGTVNVVDTLPTGLTATAISGTGWTCTLATLTCTRSDVLAASASYPAITLTVNVAANAASSITNNASVSNFTFCANENGFCSFSGTQQVRYGANGQYSTLTLTNGTPCTNSIFGDPIFGVVKTCSFDGEINTSNNTATDPTTVTVGGVSDLTITKSHTGNFTQGQTGATYTLTATNSGTLATSGTVTVVDTLPTGLTATAISGTGWTCTLATLTCTRSDVLAASASYPVITLTVDVAANAAASITNSATVSGGGETNTANDTATNPTTIATTLTPNLRLVKRITAINGSAINTVIDPTTTADPNDDAPNWPIGYLKGAIDGGLVKPNDEVEYTIYFLSDGDSSVKRVQLCDLVPTSNTFIATIFNGLTPTDGGLPGADAGIALSIGSTAPTVYLTNVGGDGQDRGQFLAPNTTAPTSCGAGSNTDGAVVVGVVTDTTTPSTLPNATAPGTPTGSYGFIRFRAKVK